MTDFENNQIDKVTAYLKATLGIIPGAGPALSEIVGLVIPKQRIDRIAEYLTRLQLLFSDEDFENLKSVPDRVAILEEGMNSVIFITNEEKRARIAYVVAHSLKREEIETSMVERVLYFARNMNDVDFVVLEYHHLAETFGGHSSRVHDFLKHHSSIFGEVEEDIWGADAAEEFARNIGATEDGTEMFKSSERYLASYGLLKGESVAIEGMLDVLDFDDTQHTVDEIINAINNVKYRITELGIATLAAMKPPQREGQV